jgi:branched-subunit amino acid ABC-type transport system permease component
MIWLDTLVQGILLGGLYALFATGLSLIFGVMRLVNLAHGDFSILAAFLAVALVQALGVNPLVALLLVVPVMGALGYGLQRVVLNRLLGRGILPAVLVTFGLSIVIQNGLLETFSADSRRLNPGGIETASLALGGGLAVGWFSLPSVAPSARPPTSAPPPRSWASTTAGSMRWPWRCRWPSWRSPVSLSASARRSPSPVDPTGCCSRSRR